MQRSHFYQVRVALFLQSSQAQNEAGSANAFRKEPSVSTNLCIPFAEEWHSVSLRLEHIVHSVEHSKSSIATNEDHRIRTSQTSAYRLVFYDSADKDHTVPLFLLPLTQRISSNTEQSLTFGNFATKLLHWHNFRKDDADSESQTMPPFNCEHMFGVHLSGSDHNTNALLLILPHDPVESSALFKKLQSVLDDSVQSGGDLAEHCEAFHVDFQSLFPARRNRSYSTTVLRQKYEGSVTSGQQSATSKASKNASSANITEDEIFIPDRQQIRNMKKCMESHLHDHGDQERSKSTACVHCSEQECNELKREKEELKREIEGLKKESEELKKTLQQYKSQSEIQPISSLVLEGSQSGSQSITPVARGKASLSSTFQLLVKIKGLEAQNEKLNQKLREVRAGAAEDLMRAQREASQKEDQNERTTQELTLKVRQLETSIRELRSEQSKCQSGGPSVADPHVNSDQASGAECPTNTCQIHRLMLTLYRGSNGVMNVVRGIQESSSEEAHRLNTTVLKLKSFMDQISALANILDPNSLEEVYSEDLHFVCKELNEVKNSLYAYQTDLGLDKLAHEEVLAVWRGDTPSSTRLEIANVFKTLENFTAESLQKVRWSLMQSRLGLQLFPVIVSVAPHKLNSFNTFIPIDVPGMDRCLMLGDTWIEQFALLSKMIHDVAHTLRLGISVDDSPMSLLDIDLERMKNGEFMVGSLLKDVQQLRNASQKLMEWMGNQSDENRTVETLYNDSCAAKTMTERLLRSAAQVIEGVTRNLRAGTVKDVFEDERHMTLLTDLGQEVCRRWTDVVRLKQAQIRLYKNELKCRRGETDTHDMRAKGVASPGAEPPCIHHDATHERHLSTSRTPKVRHANLGNPPPPHLPSKHPKLPPREHSVWKFYQVRLFDPRCSSIGRHLHTVGNKDCNFSEETLLATSSDRRSLSHSSPRHSASTKQHNTSLRGSATSAVENAHTPGDSDPAKDRRNDALPVHQCSQTGNSQFSKENSLSSPIRSMRLQTLGPLDQSMQSVSNVCLTDGTQSAADRSVVPGGAPAYPSTISTCARTRRVHSIRCDTHIPLDDNDTCDAVDSLLAEYREKGIALPENFCRVPGKAGGHYPVSNCKWNTWTYSATDSGGLQAARNNFFQFGTRRIELVVHDRCLVVIVGGGYLLFDEFCNRFAYYEQRKLEAKKKFVKARS